MRIFNWIITIIRQDNFLLIEIKEIAPGEHDQFRYLILIID